MDSTPPITQQKQSDSYGTATRTALFYLVIAGAWFLLLDFGLPALVDQPDRLLRWQTIKDLLFISLSALLLFLYLRNTLIRQRQADQAFQALQRGTAGVIGQDYFQFLTENLPSLLNTRICFVGEWDKATDTLKILAGYPEEFRSAFPAYPLKGTPCKQILKTGQAIIMSGEELQQTPMSPMLTADNISCYFGVPLLAHDGQPIGLLVSLSEHESPHPRQTLEILKTFGARASSELGRLVTERRSREQFTQLATLFDTLNAIIYVSDMETYELLYVNPFAEQLFGSDWRGKSCFSYLQASSDICAFCTNPSLMDGTEPGPPVTWEFRNTRNQRWYQCLDKCIRWTDGRLVRMEIALDITSRKQMEETKEELLSAISHEMRTPLTAITGFAELLLEEKNLPQHVTQYTQTIFNESEKMTDLINTFLELRRLKSNQARVDYEEISVREMVKQATIKLRDCSKQHTLTVECPDTLSVYGNQKELKQVVTQLLSNACRFSPEGGTVRIDARQEADKVIVCVEDSGVGIPPEEHEKIFEHFHRLDRGDNRRTGGAGLGLSLVKETINLHGGSVWVESEPGRGSRFYIALPSYTPQHSGELA